MIYNLFHVPQENPHNMWSILECIRFEKVRMVSFISQDNCRKCLNISEWSHIFAKIIVQKYCMKVGLRACVTLSVEGNC